jgi:hypothetical protein
MNMPKYDSIFNSEEYTEEPLNEAEGLASIVLIAALADNPKDLVAPDLFLDILADFDLYVEYSEEDLLSMVDRLTGIAASQGLGALFNAADEAIPDDLVPDAYAAAVLAKMNLDTGEIPAGAQVFLKELQAVMDIDDEEAAEVMAEVQKSFESVVININEPNIDITKSKMACGHCPSYKMLLSISILLNRKWFVGNAHPTKCY